MEYNEILDVRNNGWFLEKMYSDVSNLFQILFCPFYIEYRQVMKQRENCAWCDEC